MWNIFCTLAKETDGVKVRFWLQAWSSCQGIVSHTGNHTSYWGILSHTSNYISCRDALYTSDRSNASSRKYTPYPLTFNLCIQLKWWWRPSPSSSKSTCKCLPSTSLVSTTSCPCIHVACLMCTCGHTCNKLFTDSSCQHWLIDIQWRYCAWKW